MIKNSIGTDKPKELEQAGLRDLDKAVASPPEWLKQALSVPREDGYVNVDGCDIHFFRWGDPNKPGIVMLHGFLAHARCFAFIAPFLAADYHVVAYDMSGMGDSESRDGYPDSVRLQELIGVCEHTGLFEHEHRPTIIAHSYGGRVASLAAYEHSDKFAGIIICDLMVIRPSVLAANADKFTPPGNQRHDRANRVYPDYATAKQRFVLAPPQKVRVPELLDFMAYHSLKRVAGGWQWKFDPGVFKREDKDHAIWAKTGETLVKAPGRKAFVYGQESLLFNADSARYIKELISEYAVEGFPIIEIPQAGHHLMLDQPMAFISVLRSILVNWEQS